MRLIAYLRTSTTNSGTEDSLIAQEEACRKWAEANGHQVVGVEVDHGLSGGKPVDERPGLTDALACVEGGEAQGVVVHNIDRLARELHVQEAALDRAWRAGGHVFETFDGEIPRDDPDDPQRTFLRQVLGAAAQLERGMIRARLRRGRRRKRERGGYAGGPTVAFGQRVEGEGPDAMIVPDPAALVVTQRIEAMKGDDLTLQQIADALNADAVPTARGGCWHPTSVQRVLLRAAA